MLWQLVLSFIQSGVLNDLARGSWVWIGQHPLLNCSVIGCILIVYSAIRFVIFRREITSLRSELEKCKVQLQLAQDENQNLQQEVANLQNKKRFAISIDF